MSWDLIRGRGIMQPHSDYSGIVQGERRSICLSRVDGPAPSQQEGSNMLLKSFLPAAFALAVVGGVPAALAQVEDNPDPAMENVEPVQVEFVQQAGGLTYSDGRLRLVNPANMTVFFADRPRRFSGHLRNTDFAEYWTAAADGFAADPPNAAVVIAESDAPPVIVELQDFALAADGSLSYAVEVLEGELPAQADDVALFIDPVAYVGPRVGFYAGPRGGAAYVRPRRVYRPVVIHPNGTVVVRPPRRHRAIVVHPSGRVVFRPRCHFSPYYRHDVCRLY